MRISHSPKHEWERDIRTSHKDTRHILVASRDHDHSIEPMAPSSGLHLIGDEVSRLERVRHAECAHANTIADTDSPELVADETGFGYGLFDTLAESEKVFVTSARGVLIRCYVEGESRLTGFLHT